MSLIKHHTSNIVLHLSQLLLITDSYYNYDLISNANDAVPSYVISSVTSLQAFAAYLLHRRHLDFTASGGKIIRE
jgi:hypothetical protein